MFHACTDRKVGFQMETSLIFKTFLILGFQLSLVFGICLWVIKMSRKAAFANSKFMGVTFNEGTNSKGELDLQPDDTSPGLQALTWACIASMFAMVFTSGVSLTWGFVTMTTTSLTLGPVLGMIMLNMDENDGLRALQLTILITFGAGVIGLYSGLDFSGLGIYLFFALIGLILLRLVMLFTKFASGQRRLIAIGGAILFTLFLLYDFNRLAILSDQGVNDWETALRIAVSLYLDIINLLLEILEAMDN